MEKINGPVLLLSGTDDQMWDSGRFTDMVVRRLREQGHAFPDSHLSYEGTGHLDYQVIHRGTSLLDSVRIGLFLDPHAGTGAQLAACDTALDLGYSFHVGEDASYGSSGPTVGLAVLDPPLDPANGARLRPSAYVAYANGADPASKPGFVDVLAGRLPWEAVMVDSSTLQPTTFFSNGDPVSGSGWVQVYPRHPHSVLSMGPCSFAPGDTLHLLVALAVGQGGDGLSGVTDLRATVREARRYHAAGFANVPPHVARPLRAWPNPAGGTVRFSYSIGAWPGAVEITVLDMSGRRVRHWPSRIETPGSHEGVWDGTDEDGRRVLAGLYLVRTRVGGRENVARVVMVR